MKASRIAAALAALALAASAYAKDIQKLVLTPEPQMQCSSCENRIKKALKFEKGVKDIVTDLEQQTVTITYDADKTTPEKLQKALEKEGFASEQACQPQEGEQPAEEAQPEEK
ncbi:MAG TPA: heavy metal-binding protein [Porphyromonadaceae bacterium]|nr:heavy metal-binding protein [Porphyromonadaceae bacterium]